MLTGWCYCDLIGESISTATEFMLYWTANFYFCANLQTWSKTANLITTIEPYTLQGTPTPPGGILAFWKIYFRYQFEYEQSNLQFLPFLISCIIYMLTGSKFIAHTNYKHNNVTQRTLPKGYQQPSPLSPVTPVCCSTSFPLVRSTS